MAANMNITLGLEPEDYFWLEQLAAATDTSLRALCRLAIKEFRRLHDKEIMDELLDRFFGHGKLLDINEERLVNTYLKEHNAEPGSNMYAILEMNHSPKRKHNGTDTVQG